MSISSLKDFVILVVRSTTVVTLFLLFTRCKERLIYWLSKVPRLGSLILNVMK